MLTQDRLKEVLHYDPKTGIFKWKAKLSPKTNIGDIAGSKTNGYLCINIDYKPYKAHRLAYLYMEGWFPKIIKHKNGLRDDNRFENLEVSGPSKLALRKNIPSNNKSGFKGVSYDETYELWIGQIVVNGFRFRKTFKHKTDAVNYVKDLRKSMNLGE